MENSLHDMINYHVTLSQDGFFMTVYFATGLGWVETSSGGAVSDVIFNKRVKKFLKRGPSGRQYDANDGRIIPRYRIRKPTVSDVLDCLANDASTVMYSQNFMEWADNLGYDTDSRKAEAIYNRILETTKDLQRFLGTDKFNDLLNNTERL